MISPNKNHPAMGVAPWLHLWPRLQEGGVFEGPRRGIRRESYPLPSSQTQMLPGWSRRSHGKWMKMDETGMDEQ